MAIHPVFKDSRRRYSAELLGKKILVVEDDMLLRPFITTLIESFQEPYEIHWVKSVTEAVMKLANNHYQLVIADFFLEGTSTGLDLHHFCSKMYPRLPFLLMSSFDSRVLAKLMRQPYAPPPYLRKPFRPTDCREAIRSLLVK